MAAQTHPTRVYLSGPMTGIADNNFPAFHAEKVRLTSMGYDVVSPADLNPDPTTPWHECLKVDLREMLTCDIVALLPGWAKSTGAHLEMNVAHRVGIEIAVAADLPALGRLCGNCDSRLPLGCGGLFKNEKECQFGRDAA